MTWRIIVINEHSKLSYQNNNLIYRSNDTVEKIHISEIHTLMLETTDILITTALISKLVENKVRIIFCDEKRNPAGEINPYYGSHDSSRKIKQQMNWKEFVKEQVWTDVIEQKITNQRIFLSNLGKDAEAKKLNNYLEQLELFDPSNREGHAAKVYFNALFGMDFSRESDDEVNAYLNYGYTLLLSVFNREIAKNGHLTQIGLKHSNSFNPYNLSSDLMEPFRIVVDQKVRELCKLNFVKNKHGLFQIFNQLYAYKNSKMYLTNIIENYVKNVMDSLDNEKTESIPEFRICEL